MKKFQQVTKPGSLSQVFKATAALDPEGGLSYMMMSAFGMSLRMLMTLAERIISTSDASMAILAFTAGVQIRNHVVFVGSEFAAVRTKYPELIIEGSRDQTDQFNFGALHALGHVLAHLTSDNLGKMVITKAGSCVTGEQLSESEAGVINKELHAGWTVDDKAEWVSWKLTAITTGGPFLNTVAGSIGKRARDFASKMSGQSASIPARPAKPAT